MNSVWAVVRDLNGSEKVMALFSQESDAQAYCADLRGAEANDASNHRLKVYAIRHEYRRGR